MAAFLNKPSDFAPSLYEDIESQIKLLPPSEFEKPKKKAENDSSWLELKKAADEILALRTENQKLRDQQQVANLQVPTSVVRPIPIEERHYADELITRQAEEISKLKCAVQMLTIEKQASEESFEKQIATLQQEKEETIKSLREALNRSEDDYRCQVHQLRQNHEGEALDLKSHLEHLSKQLEQAKADMETCSAMLTKELKMEREAARKREDQQNQAILEKELAITNLTQQLQQLKAYVADTEQLHKPQLLWRQECETLNNQIKIIEAEKATLESSLQLMDVRLSSMKEILTTQEAELCKAKEQITDKNKMRELLLTRWRQKVYSLLTQQKSAELVAKKDFQKWQQKTSDLQEQLSSTKNTISILQHTVAAREAELKMASNSDKKLKEELQQSQQAALCLDRQMIENRDMVQMLSEFAVSCDSRTTEQARVLQQALAQLRTLGQRVSFASSRMDMIKSQLVRKNALRQLEEEETSNKTQHHQETVEDWRIERDQLTHELQQVIRERDIFALQLKQDSETWAEKLASMRANYEEEVLSLKRSVEDLEIINQNKSQQMEQILEREENSRAELAEFTERIDELRIELARHQNIMEQALEKQKAELESEWAEQLADMERRLNETRREYTKAVVKLRQQERQWVREKERLQEIQAVSEAHLQSQLTQMEEQLHAVEKERNIFMATLRQEGLLGRLRSERGEPVRLQFQDNAADEPNSQLTRHARTRDQVHPQKVMEPPEPVSELLKDLKSLAPAVLDDTEESSEEDQE
ncbi:coiled-coil alpha-helical rod protein 1-like [Pomacea canaliculata]|nr:coiled-coil alpha-helical rod protein 1-like [Pomacea canaliculata]